jgi:hypothetical protein
MYAKIFLVETQHKATAFIKKAKKYVRKEKFTIIKKVKMKILAWLNSRLAACRLAGSE